MNRVLSDMQELISTLIDKVREDESIIKGEVNKNKHLEDVIKSKDEEINDLNEDIKILNDENNKLYNKNKELQENSKQVKETNVKITLNFDSKQKLENEYKKYLDEKSDKPNSELVDCIYNFIFFLEENHLLNVNECNRFLGKNNEKK